MGPRKARCGNAHSPAFGAAPTLRYSTKLPAHRPDWNPRADDVQHNQVRAYDEVAGRCPVAFSEMLHWSIFRHAEVMRVLLDPVTFSNGVSRHVALPNGMDPPEHTAYRRAIEPYFSAQRVDAFEPTCREIAAALAQALAGGDEVEMIASLALPFAVRAQCAFLGGPETLRAPLVQWLQKQPSGYAGAGPARPGGAGA
ncbi:Erythromycin C-12 hydroxylase [compost metagenome]